MVEITHLSINFTYLLPVQGSPRANDGGGERAAVDERARHDGYEVGPRGQHSGTGRRGGQSRCRLCRILIDGSIIHFIATSVIFVKYRVWAS